MKIESEKTLRDKRETDQQSNEDIRFQDKKKKKTGSKRLE